MGRNATGQRCHQEPSVCSTNPGIAIVYTGKMNQVLVEELILDANGTQLEQCTPSCSSLDRELSPPPLRVEPDLILQEVHDDEDLLPHSVPSSFSGRRLMEARAQQCIVCFAEKEHTFVPPHHHLNGSAQQVTSHRFCTECWLEFLEHGMQPKPAGQQQHHWLVCPVCRVDISVPDQWCVRLGLPMARQRRTAQAILPQHPATSSQSRRQARQRTHAGQPTLPPSSISFAASPSTLCVDDQELTPAVFWAHRCESVPSICETSRDSSGAQPRFDIELEDSHAQRVLADDEPDAMSNREEHRTSLADVEDSRGQSTFFGYSRGLACGVAALVFFFAGLLRNAATRVCVE